MNDGRALAAPWPPRAIVAASMLAVLALLLAGCGSTPAPVEDRSAAAGRPAADAPAGQGGDYHVVKGDTLYGIAFRLGVDYRDLARLNGIGPPYTIYPGQRLRTPGGGDAVARMADIQDGPPAASPVDPAPMGGIEREVHDDAGARPPGSAAAPKPPAAPAPIAAAVPSATPPPAPAGAPTATRTVPGAGTWQWPHGGRVTASFGGASKGIDLAMARGDSVRAAAAGDVVYSGTGLRGFGSLVIVRHTPALLSAYACNAAIRTREGALVKAGDVLADTGETGTLHFEIRLDGKPVDPMRYLPRR